ncbi:ABC transporter ATP-binding protein [Granulosicoccus sp. 3-233]|uniref:ABC transporter ATP-binding protein n=1 Tax=Granulosicoccus sp. 3-233 TaxID=3417969 RepID=UPI003D32BECB
MNESRASRSAILEMGQVSFTWPRQKQPVIAIDHFAIAAGERVFLRGPSGSGKTTLLSLVSAVILPQQGHIRVDGVDLRSLQGRHRDRFRADHLGLVFQQFNLLPFLSVAENVQLPCRFSRRRRTQALQAGASLRLETERLLQRMHLPGDILERPVMQLSVGQQQRVAVARALIGRPSLIIADEPTSALDRDAQQAFIRLLFDEVAAAGSSLLFVSHDETLASGFDRQIDLAQINSAGSAIESEYLQEAG